MEEKGYLTVKEITNSKGLANDFIFLHKTLKHLLTEGNSWKINNFAVIQNAHEFFFGTRFSSLPRSWRSRPLPSRVPTFLYTVLVPLLLLRCPVVCHGLCGARRTQPTHQKDETMTIADFLISWFMNFFKKSPIPKTPNDSKCDS